MKQTGTVKWFSPVKGFGFIIPDDDDLPDVFVHYTAIEGDGYRNLREGDQVAFDLIPTGKGPQAQNVALVREGVHYE